jgi:hypothetical protein
MDDSISERKQAVKITYEKGYRVVNGNILNPKGKALGGSIKTSRGISYKAFAFRWPAKLFKRKTSLIPFHFLVAYELFGDKLFEQGIHVRHLNGNSLDNSPENIVLGTPLENSLDRLPLDRKIHALKTSWHNRKFSNERLSQIRIDKEAGMSYNKLSTKYNVNKSTLSFLFNESIYYKYPSLDAAIEAITKEFSLQTRVSPPASNG